MDRFETESDFKRYLIERLKSVAITKYDKNSGSFGGSATSVVEDKIPGVTVEKPFFDRIYEEAIKRSAEISTEPASEQLDPRILQPELRQKQQEETDQLPMLSILLPPFDEKVSVPPFEHIPYLFTRIEVLPDGLVKFDETIMVVANNQKLRYPLAKALPTSQFVKVVISGNLPVNNIAEYIFIYARFQRKNRFRHNQGVAAPFRNFIRHRLVINRNADQAGFNLMPVAVAVDHISRQGFG